MGDVTLNLRVDAYSNRVLDMVKAAYGLSNKSEALNQLAHEYGASVLEPELRKEFVEEVLRIDKEWRQKHDFKRKMSFKELDELMA
ncbi:MAG: hypothetical protein WC607_04225 [Candidatus Micrarchaeia archaeon]